MDGIGEGVGVDGGGGARMEGCRIRRGGGLCHAVACGAVTRGFIGEEFIDYLFPSVGTFRSNDVVYISKGGCGGRAKELTCRNGGSGHRIV